MLDPAQHTFQSPQFQTVLADAVQFFNNTPVQTLPLSQTFPGSSVYALYYLGTYPLYAPIAQQNQAGCVRPIYVGKAVPRGWRKSRNPNASASTLCTRLNEHASSIQQGADLLVEDFRCRFMILNQPESDLITVLEAELIRCYTPLWTVLSTVLAFMILVRDATIRLSQSGICCIQGGHGLLECPTQRWHGKRSLKKYDKLWITEACVLRRWLRRVAGRLVPERRAP